MADENQISAGVATPETVQPPVAPTPAQPAPPDVTMLNGRPPIAGPQPPAPPADVTTMNGRPPVADPLANHPAVQKASVLHRVAETLAGGPKVITTYDPMTGEATRTKKPLTTKEIMVGALANILGTIGNAAEGFSAGLQHRTPRPAQPLPTQAAAQREAQQSEEDFNRAQNMRVRQAKVMTANLEAMRTAYALGKENDDAKDSVVANHAGDLENWARAGAVEASNVPSDELLKKGFDKTKYVAIPDGRVPVFNSDGTRVTDENGVPLSQLTYSVVDGTTQAPLSQDKYDQLAKYGLMQARTGFKLPDGASISSAQLALMNHKLDLIQQTQRELDEVHDAVGGEKVDLAAQIKKNPQLLSAIEKFHNDGTSTEPDNQVASIAGKYPQAAGLMRELFGNQNLEKFKENRLARTKAEATKQEEEAREKAKAATPLGQAQLQEAQLRVQELQKKLADSGGIDMSKIQTNVLDGVTPVPDPHYRVNNDVLTAINDKDPGMAASVKAIGEARELMTPQAQRTKDGQAIMKYVNLAYPDYNAAKVDSYFKGRQTGTSGTLGNKVNSFATAMDHLQRYYDNINAISATAGVGTIAAMLGNEKAKAFETDKTALASEIATAYKQGVPSKEEIDKWEKSLGGGTAAASKNGAVETAKLLHGKFSEYANQFRNMIPGGLRDDNFQLMSDNAAKAYQHVTGIKIGSTQPLTQGQNQPQGNPETRQRMVPAGASPVTVNGQVTGYVVNGVYKAF
jgi:hypothetical protein